MKRKLAVDAKGEIAALADTINGMIETLATFADQVTNMAREVGIEGKLGGQARVPGAAGLWRDLTDNVNQLAANLTNQVRSIADVATAVTKGDLTQSIAVEASGEMAALKDNINEMIRNLKEQTLKNTEQDWLKTNLARFSRMLQGERDLKTVSNLIMSELAPLVNAQYGVFYVADRSGDTPHLQLAASYGAESQNRLQPRFALREGLIGQSAADKRGIFLKDVPPDFVKIASGLGHDEPANVVILPALFEDEVKAVIELASFNQFSEAHQTFLDQLMESVGIVLNTIAATMRTEGLLSQSQLLTAELQARQTELTTKQQELHRTNEELQEKAQLLENEKKQVENKNIEIDMARRAIEEKAEQLALTSKYKSEFLANMSHELRTPLNSLLILSKLLSDNTTGNLSEKQIEFARTIHSAGSDLLNLINDILDLSKIESGTVSIEIGEMPLSNLRQHMRRTFRQLAADKKLAFAIEFDEALPAAIRTDEKRLQQIVLNLLSNAFKFTTHGGVTLSVKRARDGWSANHPTLKSAKTVMAIAVTDTGIGIPQDKQKSIFEAFQQADGTTSRKFGGTGLGLSISREIARLLGGELKVRSQPGEGSTFTLFLPLDAAPAKDMGARAPARYVNTGADVGTALVGPIGIADDRDSIRPEDIVAVIVEDDAAFARILLDVARDAGFKGVVSTNGAGTLALVRKLRPHAITLDLGLADIDGWVLLDLLKHDPAIRHVPIHVISGAEQTASVLEMGAFGATAKPAGHQALRDVFKSLFGFATRSEHRILLIDANAKKRRIIERALRNPHTKVDVAASFADAGGELPLGDYDVIVVGAGTRDGNDAPSIISGLRGAERVPVAIVGDNAELLAERMHRPSMVISARSAGELKLHIDAILNRGVKSPEASGMGSAIRRVPELAGATVLIVDDDIRNIYSLTSVLESYDVEVVHAERGEDGIEILDGSPDIDLGLIDIMMPEMDGYETIREIRKRPAHRDLPLIAVTAKAMKGDRQKCLEAGASDYIAKPVDIELLLALLRVWIARARGRRATAGEGSASHSSPIAAA